MKDTLEHRHIRRLISNDLLEGVVYGLQPPCERVVCPQSDRTAIDEVILGASGVDHPVPGHPGTRIYPENAHGNEFELGSSGWVT